MRRYRTNYLTEIQGGHVVLYDESVEPIITALNTVLPRWRDLHKEEVEAAVAAIYSLGVRAGTYRPGEKQKRMTPGTRVLANSKAGFHKGAKGTVQFHAPDDKVWVLRDGASEAVWYAPSELELELPQGSPLSADSPAPSDTCITIANGECINPGCAIHAKTSC